MAAESSKRPAGLGGVSFRMIVLVALTIQSSILILVMHYSRIMPAVNGQRYLPSTVLFLCEVVKLAISLSMALYDVATHPKTPDTSTAAGLLGELGRAVFSGDSWKLAIPAMLYTLQSSLQYVALGNLDAPTFQVTSQLRILTTALFSIILLGKVLSSRKWLSLVLLMAGVAFVHMPVGSVQSSELSIQDLRDGTSFQKARNIWDLKALGSAAAGQLSKRSATYEGIDEDIEFENPEIGIHTSIGITTLAMACVMSGLASVYFEKILKERKGDYGSSIWIRNVQLSFYSLWPALFIGVLFQDGEQFAKMGFFGGYNWVVWAAILLQATGGILVAFVMKYADNIDKNFATSISFIFSFLASVVFFDFEITSFFIIGMAVIVSATYLYNTTSEFEDPKPRPPQIRIADGEKSGEPGYFDIESIATPARSPLLRGEALSTSRPGTPTFERLPRMKSMEMKMAKREQ